MLSKYGGLFPNQTNSEIFFFFFTFVFFNIGISNLVSGMSPALRFFVTLFQRKNVRSAFVHGSTRIAAITNVVIAFLGYLLLYTGIGKSYIRPKVGFG